MAQGSLYVINCALTRPLLIAGAEKRLVLVNAILCFPLLAASHCHFPPCLLSVTVFLMNHLGCVWLAKLDANLGGFMKRASRYVFHPYFSAQGGLQSTLPWRLQTLPTWR